MFKVGDKVKVKDLNDIPSEIFEDYWKLSMINCVGKVFVIKDIDESNDIFLDDCLEFIWHPEMLELVEEEDLKGGNGMKYWEAMKALDQGKKVRRTWWCSHEYIVLNKETREIVSQRGERFSTSTLDSDWEIYDDREDICSDALKKLFREAQLFHQEEQDDDFEFILDEDGLEDLLCALNYLNKYYKLDK